MVMRQRMRRQRSGQLIAVVLTTACLLLIGCTTQEPDMQEARMGITVTSTAFTAGKPIPVKYTGQGEDISPGLAWRDIPEGVVSFALVCDDPDAPRGTWVHWTIWNIPRTATALPEGVPADARLSDGAIQGITSAGTPGYHGPMPPPGNSHHYYFRVYALDTTLALDPSATRAQLDTAMKGHILAQGQLMGLYQRQ